VARWFLQVPDATVAAAMREFECSRQAIFAHWMAIHREHGVGDHFDAARDAIAVLLPARCKQG